MPPSVASLVNWPLSVLCYEFQEGELMAGISVFFVIFFPSDLAFVLSLFESEGLVAIFIFLFLWLSMR